jgi:hypothetical protein
MHAVSTIRLDISGGVGWDGDAIASNAISGQICDLTIRPWTFWLVTIRFPLRARFWRGWVATPIGLGRQTRSRMKSPQTCEILFHTGNLLGVRIAHHRQEVAARSSRCRLSKALLVVVRLARCSRRSDSMVNKLRIVIANEQRQLLTLVFGVFLFLMTLFAQHLQFRDSHLRRDARAADRPASHVLRDEGFSNLRSSAIALATSAVGPR